jgi:hypothetical protein
MNAIIAVILSIGAFFGSTSCYNKQVDRMQIGRPVISAGVNALLETSLVQAVNARMEAVVSRERLFAFIDGILGRK